MSKNMKINLYAEMSLFSQEHLMFFDGARCVKHREKL